MILGYFRHFELRGVCFGLNSKACAASRTAVGPARMDPDGPWRAIGGPATAPHADAGRGGGDGDRGGFGSTALKCKAFRC